MSKISTLNFLINSYNAGNKDVDFFSNGFSNEEIENALFEMEPSKKCIDTILNFASQYEVLKSKKAGKIELNLN